MPELFPTIPREFELCCETLAACAAAAAGGAHRIELCTALDVGGVTPPATLLRAALEAAQGVPVHVLLRPRAGGFHYTAPEFTLLVAQAEDGLAHGAAGIVTGVLHSDRTLDLERMRRVLDTAQGLPVTLHRAFDLTPDPARTLQQAIDLGCARILTSGAAPDVLTGRETLRALASQATGRIRIAAGGGVRLSNAASLLEIPSLDLHASLRTFSAPPASPLEQEFGRDYQVSMQDVRAITAIMHNASAR